MSAFVFLLLETNPSDAEAVRATLRAGGIDCELVRVVGCADFVTALQTKAFDLILSNYTLPDFDGMAVLEVTHNLCPEVPLIFVSASVGEERAIAALADGAAGFVLKQQLERLVSCVQRVLRQVKENRHRQWTELVRIEQQRLLELIATGCPLEKCLAAVCAAVSRLNPGIRACFLLVDAQGLTFSHSITPDFPLSLNQKLQNLPINDLCIGTCGEAVYRGVPIGCADIANDDRWSLAWRQICVTHGVLACHSQPVIGVEGLAFGSLMLCFQEARMPTEWEYQLANFGTHIASIVFERDRTNLALRESEAKYRSLFESIDEGFCVIEMIFDDNNNPIDYRFLITNPAFEKQTGSKNVIGRTVREIAPQHEDYWFEIYAQVALTGESIRVEDQAKEFHGWYEVHAFRVGEPELRRVGILFNNITERKRAEATLRASHDTFRHLVETSPFGVYVVDADFRLAQVSAGAQKIFTNVHPLIGCDFAEALQVIWPEPFASEAIARFRHTLTTGEPYHSPSTVERRYDIDEVESYDWKIERITLPDGRFGVVCHFYDLSERLRYEAALYESEEKFRNMASNAPVMVWVTDSTGYCTYLSQSWYDFTGQTEETGLSLGWLSRVHPEDRLTAERIFLNANERREGFRLEYRLQRQDGEYVWAIDAASPWFGVNGQFRGYIGSVLDISDRKQVEAERENLLQLEKAARAEAERANRIKDEFLAVLSHELRSPLNPILGWTQLLQTGKLDADRQREALETILRNAKLQTQLIEDLLDISRILRGKLSLTVANVSLTSVITAALETVHLAAVAKNIAIVLDLSRVIPTVLGDATRLQQVVWNLLTNAVKFTPNGGQVIVELRQLDQLAQIRVIDTGKGITPEFLPHVFESFRQADSTITRKFGGLGLGLAIVQQIVEMHGGSVKAESLGENQGATFTIQLPIVRQTNPFLSQSPPAKTENTTAPLSNVEILVVDDDADNRKFQGFLLEQSGAKVITVASGWEALQVLEQSIPDVLLSDIGMAEMDGYTLIQQIRSRSPHQGGTILAIALTAYAMDFDQQKALRLGFQAHITKPVKPEMLLKTILNLLERN